jgi:hypothetical protein
MKDGNEDCWSELSILLVYLVDPPIVNSYLVKADGYLLNQFSFSP